ncbi:MAG: hypothetical protein KJO07_03080 [Deltaproteobacteria bacterium]|nr:hypothetical protein [Deltaproteobacteria bacterium]
MLGRPMFVAAVAALVAAGCARSLPAGKPSAALYRDLQRLVTVAQAAEWKIDRREIDGLLPDALLSVCRTDSGVRLELDSWLAARIEALGGPVAEAYQQRGRELERVEDLLELTRVQMLLRAADANADSDCPFWLSPRPNFGGRQISDDRWQLTLGGGGRGNLLFQGGERDLSFGGAGRVLLGRSFGDRITVFAGAEFGGQASFPKDDEGNREQVEVDFELAVPVVVRYRMVNSYVELEGGYLANFSEGDYDVEEGFRIGVAFGARAPLARWFFPGAAFQILYDHVDPDAEDEPTLHTIRVGVRVAIDLNL